MTIQLGMIHDVTYEAFDAEYAAAHDSLDNNLAKLYFIKAVFGVLHRSSETSADIKICYTTASAQDQKLAAIMVNNAAIFNDTGWPSPQEIDN